MKIVIRVWGSAQRCSPYTSILGLQESGGMGGGGAWAEGQTPALEEQI